MATAYASLVSLMKVLTLYQHPKCPVSFNQPQIQSMLDRVNTLVDFLESHYSPKMSTDLLRKMADAAFAAADMIESYYVDRVRERAAHNTIEGYKILCQDMEKAIEGIDLIIREAVEVQEQHGEKEVLPERSAHVGSVLPPGGMVKMVGLDEELVHLMGRLTSDKSSLQILPIVGMGGVGKTTLARNLYEHPYVNNHFHIQAWVTISQDYSIDKVIRSLSKDFKLDEKTSGQELYQHLFGRKYLIILDDIWDDIAWNEIRRIFPDNNNGSRILLTTRISDVANSVGSDDAHEVKLIEDNKSWDLLSQTVFGEKACPPEFLKLGKEIARSCKGLPLTITVIGGILKTQKSIKDWENVASDVKSFINSENDGHCLKILSLSYDHLPIHLKPCFLYMACFREDEEVKVLDLITRWVADGFLKPHYGRTLEDVALEYLSSLIHRNLVMVAKRGYYGELSHCSLHDLLHEFCMREAQKEHFVYQLNKGTPERLERGLLCELPETQTIPFQSLPVVRSSHFVGKTKSSWSFKPVSVLCRLVCRLFGNNAKLKLREGLPFCRLLHVLISNDEGEVDIRNLVNLRYMECEFRKTRHMRRFFSSLSLYWTLETFIFTSFIVMTFPSEFWELSNLRHMYVRLYLPEPTNDQSNCVLHNLQTLGRVYNFNFSNEVVKKIPELKELMIEYDSEFLKGESSEEKIKCSLTNLALLLKLQKLTITILNFKRFREPKNITFPPSLTELKLSRSHIPWEYCMPILASLPKLQILHLSSNAFCGDEWNSTEGGEFQSLKYLEIHYCDLRIWRAESSNFPKLMRMDLWGLKLEEIPSCMADVPSLQSIQLWAMKKKSAVISAKAILDERQDNGDDDFLIEGSYWGLPEEKTELDDMAAATNNFRVKFY